MADVGLAPDPGRLPWLEPYRAPATNKPSNRRSGLTAAIGAIGLAAVVTLLNRDVVPLSEEPLSAPEASVVLPAPEDLQPQIILPPLEVTAKPMMASSGQRARPARAKARHARRKIRAIPTAAAYREVVENQSKEAPVPEVTEAALAIAAIPLPPDPPRPAVNPTARVVRGKTVQMGVYYTAGQAEAAWQKAVRDYTYLVTMPKNIRAITIRSKRFYTLQLGTPSKRHARQLCTNLKTIGRTCTVA